MMQLSRRFSMLDFCYQVAPAPTANLKVNFYDKDGRCLDSRFATCAGRQKSIHDLRGIRHCRDPIEMRLKLA